MTIQNKITDFLAVLLRIAKKNGVVPVVVLIAGILIGLVARFLLPFILLILGIVIGIYLTSTDGCSVINPLFK